MQTPLTNPEKSKLRQTIEFLLLILCLGILACRATYVETPISSSFAIQSFFDSTFSLIMSGLLIFSAVVWLLVNLCRKKFSYRFTGLELGIILFCIAAVISFTAASDKRAAITDSVTILAPMIMAALLVQLLTSQLRIKLILFTIIALGLTAAYQCAEQYFASNKMLIEQYEQNPHQQLSRLRIQEGSFQHMLYEHRLYSKDIRGFFSTGNSAASFGLLAVFAAAAVIIPAFNKHRPLSKKELLFCVFLAILLLSGFLLTHSKGAISAAAIAVVILTTYLLFGDFLRRHRKLILIISLLLAAITTASIINYGLDHNRLPGGNSMLVRWQYWTGSVKMYAEHPLEGIGGGNFALLYPRYKIAAAPEVVRDPHNFLLKIITEYGPAGLLALLAAIFIPLGRIIFPKKPQSLSPSPQDSKNAKYLSSALLISALMLALRPLVLKIEPTDDLAVKAFSILYLYVMPAIIFLIGFMVISTYTKKLTLDTKSAAVIFCAILAVLIHNLIDFAIFEPGVLTAFWSMLACLIALNSEKLPAAEYNLKPAAKILAAALCTAAIFAYLHFVILPVYKCSTKTKQATITAMAAGFDPDQQSQKAAQLRQKAYNLLAQAASDDPLTDQPLTLAARFYQNQFHLTGQKDISTLLAAEKPLLDSINRNPADFKNLETLSDLYSTLADNSSEPEKTTRLHQALDTIRQAVERFPNSDRLRLKLAMLADKLNLPADAIENYQQAVDIEDSYRNQFKQMYGDRKLFSRLGEQNYNFAKSRLKQLTTNP